MFNTELLHQIHSFSKVVTKLVLPHVMHINPLHLHIGVLLVLDDIQIDVDLLLVPEQLTASKGGTRRHIRVKLPETDIISLGNLIHALSGLLVLASRVLDIAIGGRRAFWYVTWVVQTFGASVTTGVGPARATT